MAISIKIKGISKVQQFLKNTESKIYKKANEGIIKAGFFVQSEVQESIAGHRAEPRSVDTGRFLGNIKAEQKAPLTATISSNVGYGQFLEYGTSRMKPRHHFTNTVQRNKQKVTKFVEEEIGKVI